MGLTATQRAMVAYFEPSPWWLVFPDSGLFKLLFELLFKALKGLPVVQPLWRYDSSSTGPEQFLSNTTPALARLR